MRLDPLRDLIAHASLGKHTPDGSPRRIL